MKRWVKPAVGWGIVFAAKNGNLSLLRYYCEAKGMTGLDDDERFVPVALVPLAAARKAGLLRRPK